MRTNRIIKTLPFILLMVLLCNSVFAKEKVLLPLGFNQTWSAKLLFNSEGGYAGYSSNEENSIHGWSKLYEAQENDAYSISMPTKVSNVEHGRVQFKTPITLLSNHSYRFQATLYADKFVPELLLQLSENENDNSVFFSQTLTIEAGKRINISSSGLRGTDIEDMKLALNIATEEENTTIKLSGIRLYDETEQKEIWVGTSYYNYCYYWDEVVRYRIKDMVIDGRVETLSWADADFDDSMWKEAEMPIGERGYMSEVKTEWPGGDNTNFWIRRDFELDELNESASYYVLVCHDDTYSIYVNGHLIDSQTDWTSGKDYKTLEVPVQYLNVGKNVIATYIQQNWGGKFYDCGMNIVERNSLIYDEGTSADGPEGIDKLFDDDIFTKWCNVNYDSPRYVIFHSPEPIVVTGYEITTANDTGIYSERNPRSWTLYGFDGAYNPGKDADAWEVIASVTYDTLLQAANLATSTYTLPAPTSKAYQYFMWVITEPSEHFVQVSEFFLNYTKEAISSEFQGAKRIFADNLLKSSTYDDKTFTYHYDSKGFVTQVDRVKSSGSGKTYTITYGEKIVVNCSDGNRWTATVNSQGFIGAMDYWDEKGNAEHVTFTYNGNNQLSTIDYGDGDVFNLTYTDGNITRVTNYGKVIDYGYESSGQGRILNTGKVMEFDNIFGIDVDDFNLLYYIGALGYPTKHLPLYGMVDGATITGSWTTDVAGRAIKAQFSDRNLTWNWDDNGGQGGDDTGDNIIFADANVKALCVQNWDTNGDGELSKTEAAAVKSIGKVFYLAKITSFDELRYFTGLTAIEEQAFFQSDITSVIIPSGVTSIGKSAFSYCGDLTSLTLPDRLSSIEAYAFFCCWCLTSIYIPRSLTSIDPSTFSACKAISTIIVDPENSVYDSRDDSNAIIRKSDNTIVYGCKNTVIPTTVVAIGSSAFSSTDGLINVTIPDNVTLIDGYSYSNCDSMRTMTIGSGIKEIKKWAFHNCKSLKNFYCNATTPPTTSSDIFDDTPISSATLHVPKASVNLYKSTAPWSGFGSIVAIGDDVEDPNPLLLGTWRYDFDTNSYILLTFSQDGTVRYQEYDGGRWQSDEVYSYSFSNNALKITDSNGNVKGVIEVLTLTSTTLKLNGWPDGGVSIFIKQNGNIIESAVLNGSIIGQWNIVSGSYTRYENDVEVSHESGTLIPPYDKIAFYNNGTMEFLEYSTSSNSYHEDGKGTYTIKDNKFVFGGGDWDNFIITSFDGNNMEVYFQFSENKVSTIVRKVYRTKLQRVTGGGDEQEYQTDNTLAFSGNLKANVGVEFSLPIELTNKDGIAGVQFDLYLPDGIQLCEDEYGDYMVELSRTTIRRHSVASRVMSDGALRVVVSSQQNATFSGNSGTILTLRLLAKSTMEAGNYTVKLKNIVLTDPNAKRYAAADVRSTITVITYTMGDVNNDGYIDVADLAGVVRFILENADASLIFNAADMDGNGIIEINDYAALVNVILAQDAPKNAPRRRSNAIRNDVISLSDLYLNNYGEGEMAIRLRNNDMHYTGLQFDLCLPDGIELIEDGAETMDIQHGAWVQKRKDGNYRVVCASMMNDELSEGDVLHLQVKITGAVNINHEAIVSNVVLADQNAARYEASPVKAALNTDDATSISEELRENSEESANVIFNLSGQRLNKLQKGVNIVNGKKAVVK
jgi:hypothetical protein